MKKILAITSLLFASLSLFGAQACVQFFGGDFKLDNDAMPSNVKISKVGKAGLSIDLDVDSTKWQTLKIVGTAEKKMSLRLMYNSKKGKNAMPVFFDNIKVNGQLLPNGDFSSGDFDSWFLPKKRKPVALANAHIPNGKGKSAYVEVGRYLMRNIPLQEGQRVEIEIDCLAENNWSDSLMLDISKDCNVVVGDESSFAKNLKAPKTPKVYGGMIFSFADKNGQPNVMYLKPSESKKYEIENQISAKYLYLMYSTKRVVKKKPDVVRVNVKFVSGRTRSRSLKLGEDVQFFDNKIEALDNALQVHIDNKKENTGGVYITRVDLLAGGNEEPIKTIEISSMIDFQIYGATLSSREVFTTEILKYTPDKWVKLDMEDLDIKEGSALDVSQFTNHHAPAGKYGRVVVGRNGDFEFEKRPNVPIRFKGANVYTFSKRIGDKIKTKEEIDFYVKMIKKQGYNAVRWRFNVEEGILNEKSEVKAEYLDMYDYFLYALKREGIYTYFYITSHDVGVPNFDWNDRTTIKMRMMLGDPQIREIWRKWAIYQLSHVNKYTGVAWKDEPAIATIEYWNEFDLGFGLNRVNAKTKNLLAKKLREFLKNRYKTIDAFLAYNKQIDCKWATKKPLTDFEDITLDLYFANSFHPDFGRFVIALMQDVLQFYRKVVSDEIGCKAVTFQNNCVKNLYWTHCGVSIGSSTAINTYHDIASSTSVGARVKQTSSIHNSGNYWRGALSRNVAGMPLTVTEYQHCYPNQYCHELALMFPVYSAFQNIGALMIFDTPMARNNLDAHIRNVGVNPVHRVNDFLTSFFYLRGDVKPSQNRVDIVFDKNFFQKSNFASGALLQDESMIGLLTGFKLSFPDVKRVPELKNVRIEPATISYKPQGISRVRQSFHASSVDSVWHSKFSWDKVMADLKEKKILSPDNRSDPKNAVFESDTKQIYMDSKNRLLQVNTPKSVGTTIDANSKNLRVGSLMVKSSNVDGAVALVSLDNKEIVNSSKMVLTFATDSVWEKSKFSVSRKQVLQYIPSPVLIKIGKIDVMIKTNGKNFAVYPLKMNGERMAEIPVKVENGILKLSIDNSKTPTLYFEIERK